MSDIEGSRLDEYGTEVPASQTDRDEAAGELTAWHGFNGLDEAEAATLRDMVRKGTPQATVKAAAVDLSYLEAWSRIAFGEPLPWPATENLIARFLAHHFFDAERRAGDANHGMPAAVERGLRDDGYLTGRMPPALSTIERRLATWSKLHAVKGLDSPFRSPSIRALKRSLVAGFDGAKRRKSPEPVTVRELAAMLRTCAEPDNLKDLRDRALLAAMYATGGRRRCEVGRILVRQISFSSVPADPSDPMSPTVRAMRIAMPKTKTTRAGEAEVWAVGFAADAMHDWLKASGHTALPSSNARAFPRIYARKVSDSFGRLIPGVHRYEADSYGPGLSGEGVRLIVRSRLALAGLDPDRFSPHGLRAGFLTDAQRQGVPLAEAMMQSLHRSEKQAMRYYAESAVTGKAARMLPDIDALDESAGSRARA